MQHDFAGLSQAVLRPKLMTVPARGRGKASPLIIPVSVGNNLQLNQSFTGKSIVDLWGSVIRIPGNYIARQNTRSIELS